MLNTGVGVEMLYSSLRSSKMWHTRSDLLITWVGVDMLHSFLRSSKKWHICSLTNLVCITFKKGLLTLFQTYEFSLQNTVLNGTLQYYDHSQNEKKYFAYERIRIHDYEQLMNLAIEKQSYAVAVSILKGMVIQDIRY